jgi:UDP:flavonoid glycosyltransferase YjiC (YdhE family)
MTGHRRKVLFFAEGATLAHVARPFVLAGGLSRDHFEIVFARPSAFAWLTDGAQFPVVDLQCQAPSIFAHRLDHGLPLYDLATLEQYVEADLALIDSLKPDVVVGDFRLSLSVSARLRGVPYVTICDVYWSPELPLDPQLPVLGFTPYLPLAFAERIFRTVAPLAFRLNARPMERLRARHGLPSLGHDLRRCYTDADLRLFANFPALFSEVLPSGQADFVGPVAWSPPDREDLVFPEGEGPLVYLTMGSSGDPRALATLIPVLEEAGARVMVASAGRSLPPGIGSPQTRIYDFLPGDQLCRHAQMVVCNGGSPSTNQALAYGVPVLGVARNMDQFLNMKAIEHYGAGLVVRSDRLDRNRLPAIIDQLLGETRFSERAAVLAGSCPPTAALAGHLDAPH